MEIEYGLDKSRFPNLKDEAFDCVICSEVARNPKECSNCGGLFCKSCIDSWLIKKRECPNRCATDANTIKPVGRALLKIYNDLDVQCVYFENCHKIVKMADLEQHEKVCRLPKCINYDLCGVYLKQGDQPDTACSRECALLLSLKGANGDWKLIHKELKNFLGEEVRAVAPVLEHSKSIPTAMGESTVGKTLTFGWNPLQCGTNIKLSENNTKAFLKEGTYIFKTVMADQGFTGGVHYWEIVASPETENELKIGVSTKKEMDCNSAFCDFEHGFAYYGLGQLRHGSNANGIAYGRKFKKDGVLGVCLDMNKGTLAFGLDGSYFGVAFTSEALKRGPIFPAVALLHCAGCKLVTGKPVPKHFLSQ